MAMCYHCGLTANDLEEMTVGMCINFINAFVRQKKRMNGENVPDPEQQYKKMKAIEEVVEERHRSGAISDEKYREYRKMIDDYEAL